MHEIKLRPSGVFGRTPLSGEGGGRFRPIPLPDLWRSGRSDASELALESSLGVIFKLLFFLRVTSQDNVKTNVEIVTFCPIDYRYSADSIYRPKLCQKPSQGIGNVAYKWGLYTIRIKDKVKIRSNSIIKWVSCDTSLCVIGDVEIDGGIHLALFIWREENSGMFTYDN